MRHLKESIYEKNVEKLTREILASEYEDSMFNYFDARKQAINTIKQKQKLSTIISVSNNDNSTKTNYTYYDSFDNSLSFVESDKSIILSHPLNFFMVKKILPVSLDGILEKVKSYDNRKVKNKKDFKLIFDDIKTRILTRNFVVKRFDSDKAGKFSFETSQSQPGEGSCMQYIYVTYDPKKIVQLKNKTKKSIGEVSKEYRTLLMYYTIFDSNEIYMRCTCKDYLSKKGKKLFGSTNYMCNHLMWSMANLPYYLTYYYNSK